MFDIIACPQIMLAAAPAASIKPAVDVAPLEVPKFTTVPVEELYPVVTILPEPIWIRMFDVPLNETPLNNTVIRLTQLGKPVKSMLVPEVEATEVPDTTLDARAAPPAIAYQVVLVSL